MLFWIICHLFSTSCTTHDGILGGSCVYGPAGAVMRLAILGFGSNGFWIRLLFGLNCLMIILIGIGMSNRIIGVCSIIIFIISCSRLFGLRAAVVSMRSRISAIIVLKDNCVFATMFSTLAK